MLGKLIVLDGTDASGKATQIKELAKHLTEDGYGVEVIEYPNYNTFFGKLIWRYLNGEFGSAASVSPYLISTVYACDRLQSKEKIKQLLEEGKVVLCNRYTTANMIHQGGKIVGLEDKADFLRWIKEMEFDVFKLAVPDLVLYLDVPIEFGKALQEKKNRPKDIHESSEEHLFDSKKQCETVARFVDNWVKIDCVKNGGLMSVEDVYKLVYDEVKKVLSK